MKAQIYCVQETRIKSDREAFAMQIAWAKCFGKSINAHTPNLQRFSFWSNSQQGRFATSACGTGILVDPRLNATIVDVHHRDDGRASAVCIEQDGERFSVWCIYAPHGKEQHDFYRQDLDLLPGRFPNPILGGDLNVWLSPTLDYIGGPNGRPRAHAGAPHLRHFMQAHTLTDTFREQSPDEIRTSRRPGPRLFPRTRIDLWLTPPHTNHTFTVKHRNAARLYSDHQPVELTVTKTTDTVSRGKGFWKFNCSLLEDDDFVAQMTSELKAVVARAGDFASHGAHWEAIKQLARTEATAYGKMKAQAEYADERALRKDIARLDGVLGRHPADENCLRRKETLLDQLGAHEKRRTMGAAIRARAITEAENGNRGSKYFFGLEKSRGSRGLIRELFDPVTHVRVSTSVDPTGPMQKFMMNLFASPDAAANGVTLDPADSATDPAATNEVLDTITARLTPEQVHALESDITRAEALKALKSLRQSASPGEDGLPAAFLLLFFPEIGDVMLLMLREAVTNQLMPASMRNSVIKFLYKKGCAAEPRNYRPVSLTGADYRVLGKILAMRLTEVLASIVHHSQTAAIPGRNITDNVALLQALRTFTKARNLPDGIFLFADMRKAYDRVDHVFLDKVLARFGFGQGFRSLVQLLNNGATAAVCINGHISPRWRLGRGVRQGCPASMALFVLYIEALGCYLRAGNLEGIPLPRSAAAGEKCVSGHYADDTTITVLGIDAAKAALARVQRFCEASGARLNVSKTIALWIGATAPPPPAVCNTLGVRWIHLTGEPHRALGMLWGATTATVWEDMIATILQSALRWNRRGMGLRGKILVAKQMLLSRAVYLALILPPPPRAVTEIKAIVANFLHRKFETDDDENKIRKPGFIAENVLIGLRSEGGAQMMDFGLQTQALSFSWFRKLVSAQPGRWRDYALWDALRRPESDDPSLLRPLEILVDLPSCERNARLPIMVAAFKAAQRVAFGALREPESKEEVAAQPLFDNTAIGDRQKLLSQHAPLRSRHLAHFRAPRYLQPFESGNPPLVWVQQFRAAGLTRIFHLVTNDGTIVKTANAIHQRHAVRVRSYEPLRRAILTRWGGVLGDVPEQPRKGEFFRLIGWMQPLPGEIPGVRIGRVVAMKARRRIGHGNWGFVDIDGTRHKVEHFRADQIAYELTIFRVDPATNLLQLVIEGVWRPPMAVTNKPIARVRVLERRASWRHADPMDIELEYYGDVSRLVIDPLRFGIPLKKRGAFDGLQDKTLLFLPDITVRRTYRALADFSVQRPNAEAVWKQEWGNLNLSPTEWSHIYATVHDVCLPTTTQELLYKIITRRLWPMQRQLDHNFQGVTSASCLQCSAASEDHTHLFYTCPPAFALWRRIFILLSSYAEVRFLPTNRSVIGGVLETTVWLTVNKTVRKKVARVWRTTRALALVVIRRARNDLLKRNIAYDDRSLFYAWRSEFASTLYRADLYPQGRRLGQTVDVFLHRGVYAERIDRKIVVRCRPR